MARISSTKTPGSFSHSAWINEAHSGLARIFSRAENEKVFDPLYIYALSIIITRGIIFSAGNQSRQQEEGWRQGAGSFKRHKFGCPCYCTRAAPARIHFCVRLPPHNETAAYYSSPNHSHALAECKTWRALPSWFRIGPNPFRWLFPGSDVCALSHLAQINCTLMRGAAFCSLALENGVMAECWSQQISLRS